MVALILMFVLVSPSDAPWGGVVSCVYLANSAHVPWYLQLLASFGLFAACVFVFAHCIMFWKILTKGRANALELIQRAVGVKKEPLVRPATRGGGTLGGHGVVLPPVILLLV